MMSGRLIPQVGLFKPGLPKFDDGAIERFGRNVRAHRASGIPDFYDPPDGPRSSAATPSATGLSRPAASVPDRIQLRSATGSGSDKRRVDVHGPDRGDTQLAEQAFVVGDLGRLRSDPCLGRPSRPCVDEQCVDLSLAQCRQYGLEALDPQTPGRPPACLSRSSAFRRISLTRDCRRFSTSRASSSLSVPGARPPLLTSLATRRERSPRALCRLERLCTSPASTSRSPRDG
jgi:hypothetical protein